MPTPITGVTAIVPAAGIGLRFGARRNKVLEPLLGRPILGWTLDALAACPEIDAIVLAVADDDAEAAQRIAEGVSKPVRFAKGGLWRSQSVLNALEKAETLLVAVHDAARPLVTPDIMTRCVESAHFRGTGIAAIPIVDTLNKADDGRTNLTPVERDGLWAMQTPQSCRTADLLAAHRSEKHIESLTDEAALLQRAGIPVHLVNGSSQNIKITLPDDLALAEAILRARGQAPRPETQTASTFAVPRIGFGYDVHRFQEGRRMVLGGVDFGLDYGLLGHSDADAILHAVMDALLGAAGLPDIGHLFPNTVEDFRGASSLDLMRSVMERIRRLGYVVGNVDVTVIAERPKIGPRATEMKTTIARALGIAETAVGLKATTAEGLGDLGSGEGLAAHAVCLLIAVSGP